MSSLWTSAELCEALGVEFSLDKPVKSVVIDSRRAEYGALFVALQGERVDGHDYVVSAFEKGASAALVREDKVTSAMREAASLHKAALLEAPEVEKALAALGRYRRLQSRALTFAVTGSVGKTSVKEMLAFMLSHIGETHATQGNYNNHLGLPLTLANMRRDAAYAVIEAGMNHEGELRELTHIAQPDVAVVTMIAPVHLANFPNMEGVATAKAEIFEGVPEGGVLVAAENHPYADILRDAAARMKGRRYVSAGAPDSDARVVDYMPEREESVIGASIFGKSYVFRLGAPGRHQANNAVLALAALKAADVNVAAVIDRLVDFFPVKGRGARLVPESGKFKGLTIVDDSYNAGPASVCAAIETVGERLKQGESFFLALGDMLELGEGTEKYYRMIAHALVNAKAKGAYLVGKDCAVMKNALPDSMICATFPDSETLAENIASILPADVGILLVKGSRGMKMEKIIEAF
ncbi:MAG: UDP-N-acetylmuramoyl-tripeptide--D-alanyl-D-alanine ligase [Rickettsiales bacterium]